MTRRVFMPVELEPEVVQAFADLNRMIWRAVEDELARVSAEIMRGATQRGLVPAGLRADAAALPNDSGLVDTLLDLARAGDETTFRDLARCEGVAAEHLDDLWAGTLRRLGKEREGQPE